MNTNKLVDNVLNDHLSQDDLGNIYFESEWAAIDFAEAYHEAKCAESEPNGWISVEDRLPPERDIVAILVGSWGNFPYTGYLEEGGWHDTDGDFVGNGFNAVSHWMYLPKLPKQALEKMGE